MANLNESVGAILIGCIFTSIFYGVTCLQVAQYFLHYRHDGGLTKILVLTILTLDTLHLILVSHFAYTLAVLDFGNEAMLTITPWSLAASFFVSMTSDTVIRIFFARRVWYLSQRNWLVAIGLTATIILAFAATLLSSVDVLILSIKNIMQLHNLVEEWKLVFTFASSVVTDFSIAATLCFYFLRSRGEYFEGTNNLMNKLCKYTVNTGILATVWALCCLVSFVLMPNTHVELAFYLPLSKLYVNAFLGSLNVRDSLRAMNKAMIVSPNMNSIASSNNISDMFNSSSRQEMISKEGTLEVSRARSL